MHKKCIICDAKATLCVKGMTNDSYCEACASENFADLSYLERIDDIEKEITKANSVEDILPEEKEE